LPREHAYDRTLLASAKVIGEQLDVEDDEAIPPARDGPLLALEAFEADKRSRLFYRVSSLNGEMVSGFAELPFWRGKLPQRPPYAALVDFITTASRTKRSGSPCCGPWPA
jgi:two-component system sensor histidine kinase TctE